MRQKLKLLRQFTWVTDLLMEPIITSFRVGLQLVCFFLSLLLTWVGQHMRLQRIFFWRFSWPTPLLGKTIVSEFYSWLNASIKAAMDLLSIAILVQFCIVILLPSKQSSGRAAQGDSIMTGPGEEGINIYKSRKDEEVVRFDYVHTETIRRNAI